MALTIHLGAHKTASSHLQHSLALASDELRRAGIFYAGPTALRGDELPLADALSSRRRQPARMVRDRLAPARETFPEILLSEENILGRTGRQWICGGSGLVYPAASYRVRRMIALAAAGPATLFLGIRDPASFYVSTFALQFSEGREVDFETYLNGRDPARIGWAGLIGRLGAIDSVARIVVWRYEDYPALRPQLLARLLPPGLAARVPDPPPVNESVTQPGYDWFVSRALNDSEIDLRVLARRARLRFRRADGHPPLRPLPDSDYQRSREFYARQVARLRRLPKVEFLEP
ncbi:hypothetical protein SAMN04487972_1386 [Paracoccus halophilus]|uniref:Sulfotransferase family protein n=1 Tax=Paracoccus halophilus TaxID=376733 RepID=A0A099F5Y8_9RHOB|nr:hypothetical protein [Paracoccus halophilus]KGJ05874.1 hypothetical protein IT41_04180 [Paracoccus halophilus]SFA61618.1 hypothetical protein SAMN04487972_1386 [Paracoccus halophilus]